MTEPMNVGDIAGLVRGTTYKGALVGAPGPALLGLGSIVPGGGFRGDSFKTYGGHCPDKLMLFPGDLYVSLKGATKDGEMIGSIARVPHDVLSGRLTQDTVKLQLNRNDYKFSSYIYWLLRTPHYRAYCAGRATGSAVVALSREDFLAYPVPEFSNDRREVTELLDAIEEKITLNRRMNETLEAMARAIFRNWFVDFGPTRAKMEGRAPYLSPDIWALFPDRLDDEGRPEGWLAKPLDEIADFLNGLALQKYPPVGDGDLPVIKIAQLRTGSTDGAGLAAASIASRYIVEDGDVLFSWSGSLTQVLWAGGRGALNQHLFKVSSNEHPKWLYYFWVDHHLPEFQAIAASKATTMGHIQRHHLSEAATTIGDAAVMAAASDMIEPLFNRLLANAVESRTLAATRDLLLPKLMSGEIRIREAEAMVADAA
ncbi:restriction endonuclease subunit S [Sphingobium sp. R-7]|uniref:restriction endonuclease subunit S n=1 Tax=Sphingobium sp. R-7 TaxID=3375449 RepID=UPI00398B5E05